MQNYRSNDDTTHCLVVLSTSPKAMMTKLLLRQNFRQCETGWKIRNSKNSTTFCRQIFPETLKTWQIDEKSMPSNRYEPRCNYKIFGFRFEKANDYRIPLDNFLLSPDGSECNEQVASSQVSHH